MDKDAERFSSIQITSSTTEYVLDEQTSVKLLEVMSSDYGHFMWPCSVVLAEYVHIMKEELEGKNILELGCGTALPGIVASMFGADVILSDLKQDTILNNIRAVVSLNKSNLQKEPSVIGINWGEIDENLLQLPPQDIILGADLMYEEADFENLIMTVAFLLEKNNKAKFITSYQNRSESYMSHLLLLLSKWNLSLLQLPLEDFFPEHKRDLLQNKDIQLFAIQRTNKYQIDG